MIDFTPEIKAKAMAVVQQYDRGSLFTPPSGRGTVQPPGNGGGASPFLVKLIKPDPARSNFLFRRGPTALPTVDGLPLVKPPYSRLTAYDLNRGTIAWQIVAFALP